MSNSERIERLRVIASVIARGHAFAKHAAQFGDESAAAFEIRILGVLLQPSETIDLPEGRTAYWSDAELMVVFHDPSRYDLGTAFRPKQGKAYLSTLERSR